MSTADSSGSGEQGPGGAQGPGEQPQSTVAVARGRVPDFFIVGHAKSGTTALYSMLRRHPQIFMPDAKEPWFFAEELHERTPPRPEGTPKTLEQYVALVRRRRRRAAGGGGLAAVSVVAHGSRADRAGAPGRAHRRDPARAGELPALASHAVRAELHRGRERLRQGARARGRAPRRARDPALHVLAAGAPVLRARPLCRAAASLPGRVRTPSSCSC